MYRELCARKHVVWVWQSDDPAWTIDLTAERDARKYLFGPLLCKWLGSYVLHFFLSSFPFLKLVLSYLSFPVKISNVWLCVSPSVQAELFHTIALPLPFAFDPGQGGDDEVT